MLHLALISFNEIFKHLLGANANFKVINFLLEFLRHVAFIDMLSDSDICGKWIIWPSEDIHSIAHRRTEQLRVMLRNEIFPASMIANGLQPGSVWLQLMYKFSSLDHIAKKTIFEVKHMAMSMLQQSMTCMIMDVGLFICSAERHQ